MNPNRRLPPGEAHPCFVGSGECLINAHWGIDDGSGNEVYICRVHLQQFEETAKAFAKLSPHKFEQLEAAIDEAQRAMMNDNPPNTP